MTVAASSGGANSPMTNPTPAMPVAASVTAWSLSSTVTLPFRSLLTTAAPQMRSPQFSTAS